jgi:hypothetical protein
MILDKIKALNTGLMCGLEDNIRLGGSFYSSMEEHKRIIKQTMAIKIILEI